MPTDATADACVDCGRESDDLARHAEAAFEGVLCLVCRDQYDEEGRGPGGDPA